MITDKIKAKGEAMSVLEGLDRIQYIIDGVRDMEPLKDKFKRDVLGQDMSDKYKYIDPRNKKK